MSGILSYAHLHLSISHVRHASELTPDLIQCFPYDLRYCIHRYDEKPEELVKRARLVAHQLGGSFTGLSTYKIKFYHQLADRLFLEDFIRDDLNLPTLRVIRLYDVVATAPTGWFNHVYELESNLDPSFIDSVLLAIKHTFEDAKVVKQITAQFGLLPEQLPADTSDADSSADPSEPNCDSLTSTLLSNSSAYSAPNMSQGRLRLYYCSLAKALPPFHGVGGPGPDRITELLAELTHLLENNCLSDAQAGYCHRQFQKLADMCYGPDLGKYEQAYELPLSQLWLRPETYGVLRELGFETVGDVLASTDDLLSD